MAREIKIKKADGKFEPIPLPQTEKLNSQLKNPAVKFPDDAAKKVEMIREIREYELITPLFGGGVTTKKADEVSVIRATEIRGHLRFWWRATRGGQFATIEDLKKHEDAIFGSTEGDSALKIEIILEENYEKRSEENEKNKEILIEVKDFTSNGRTFPKPFSRPRMKDLQYVAFPLQPNDKEKKQKTFVAEIRNNIKFRVIFSYPQIKIKVDEKEINLQSELQSALWAWENFGGIGARTRRGFGAIKLCEHILNGSLQRIEFFESEIKLKAKAESYISSGKAPKGIPYLNKKLRLTILDEKQMGGVSNSEAIWKTLIMAYKSFRQQRNETARSKWNEPEAIRNLINQRLTTRDSRGNVIEEETHEARNPDFEKFPRAAFGLPIIYKFHSDDTWEKDKRILDKNDWNLEGADYDPRKTILNLTGYERYSSPLILRPLATKGGYAVGIALILENEKKIDEIGLTLEAQEGRNWSRNNLKSALSATEAKEIKVATKTTFDRLGSDNLLGDETDVLQAFLNYLEK